MLTLSAKIRKIQGKKVKTLREKGVLPVVLYGPKIKNENLEVNLKDFEKILDEAGESTLLSLEVEGKKEKNLVLIHEIKFDPMSSKPTHADFYQPILTEEIQVKIPLIIEGEAPAVKNLGGTLVKNISEIEVRALPQHLPKEIKVNVGGLEAFGDKVLIKDLQLPEGVKISRSPEEVIAHVAHPEKVEEELQKPIEEKVEDVEKIEKEKKDKGEEVKEPAGGEKAKKEEGKPSSAKTSAGKEK
ncbi:MAG: 50S ribosomal protein L25 [Candidatus Nealsonbacteria bacterium]